MSLPVLPQGTTFSKTFPKCSHAKILFTFLAYLRMIVKNLVYFSDLQILFLQFNVFEMKTVLKLSTVYFFSYSFRSNRFIVFSVFAGFRI